MLDHEEEITAEALEKERAALNAASETEEKAPVQEQPETGQAVEPEATEQVDAKPDEDLTKSEQSEDLPEKFKGKTAAEIAKAYEEAERRMHEVASERAAERRKAEELQARWQQFESKTEVESDPLHEIEKVWEQDPKEAVSQVYKKLNEKLTSASQKQLLEQRAKEAAEYYNTKRAENPDFVEREADMQEFARRIGHVIKPEYAQTKEVIEALYLMSRGHRVDAYEKAAAEKASKQQQLIKDEKRKAASESAVSRGETNTFASDEDFSRLSAKQQREELARMRKSLA